jgi:hypothetical protein
MEDWLLKHKFYYGLTQRSREQLDATAEGSFMSLTLGKAEYLMEKIAKNQSWKQDNTQRCRQIEEVLEEVCALSTKMDTLLNWLDQRVNFKKDHQAIQDAFDAQTRCEEYLGMEIPENQEDANIINNSSNAAKAKMESKATDYISS